MFGKIVFVFALVLLIVLAIMFDWFGSRDIAQKGVEGAQKAVEQIQDTGDQVSETIDSIKEKGKE